MPYYSRKMLSSGAVLKGIWRGFSMSFVEEEEEKKQEEKKIEENKNSLYKYIEGWGTSFCCLSKLCLPITAMSIV